MLVSTMSHLQTKSVSKGSHSYFVCVAVAVVALSIKQARTTDGHQMPDPLIEVRPATPKAGLHVFDTWPTPIAHCLEDEQLKFHHLSTVGLPA